MCGEDGARAQWGVPVIVGCNRVHHTHDWLCATDSAAGVKRVEVDTGVREGVTTNEAQQVKDLERE